MSITVRKDGSTSGEGKEGSMPGVRRDDSGLMYSGGSRGCCACMASGSGGGHVSA